jgi:hypothetical protein
VLGTRCRKLPAWTLLAAAAATASLPVALVRGAASSAGFYHWLSSRSMCHQSTSSWPVLALARLIYWLLIKSCWCMSHGLISSRIDFAESPHS